MRSTNPEPVPKTASESVQVLTIANVAEESPTGIASEAAVCASEDVVMAPEEKTAKASRVRVNGTSLPEFALALEFLAGRG
jgi:hypothetical protein